MLGSILLIHCNHAIEEVRFGFGSKGFLKERLSLINNHDSAPVFIKESLIQDLGIRAGRTYRMSLKSNRD